LVSIKFKKSKACYFWRLGWNFIASLQFKFEVIKLGFAIFFGFYPLIFSSLVIVGKIDRTYFSDFLLVKLFKNRINS
jgi:hypothetical protein